MDGAPGGVMAAIARQRPAQSALPIRFIGVGEGLNDLRPFVASEFVEALFD
jgi:fused signal recognition particle receptor